MTQAYNLSQLANNLTSAGLLDAADGLINAVPIANGGTGATTASGARTNLGVAASAFSVPTGGIIMWSGSIASIPAGWYICDGTNGTPNLTNRFVVMAGGVYAVGASGGSADAVVVSHTHTGTTSTIGNHAHGYSFPLWGNGESEINSIPSASDQFNPGRTYSSTTDAAGTHQHTFTTNSTGSSGVGANLPPYYALAYIMKS
jgi:hypothetical protein